MPSVVPEMSSQRSSGYNFSTSGGAQTAASQQAAQSTSFIPEYSQTPILESIAQYAQNMAPQVYDWGMQQYAANQGNINNMIQAGLTYASPAQQAVDMGAAAAGVTQAGEKARQASIQDLQSYGIDPSAGRYAGLDQANRVQTAASAAGAANQQRMADIATGNAMVNQGISSSIQNAQGVGLGTANAANQYLGTGMQLQYSPLGTQSASMGASSSSGVNTGASYGQQSSESNSVGAHWTSANVAAGGPVSSAVTGPGMVTPSTALPVQPFYDAAVARQQALINSGASRAPQISLPNVYSGVQGAPRASAAGLPGSDVDMGRWIYYKTFGHPPIGMFQQGGGVNGQPGGFVSQQLSPSAGARIDDVQARLNAGEFVIPKDVAEWKGQEFFYKLMAQARQARVTAQQDTGAVGAPNNGAPPPSQATAGQRVQ